MASIRGAMFLLALIISQAAFADCNTTIPGHYEGRYIDNGNGTITDRMTRLTWMKCELDMVWDPIQNICKTQDAVPGEPLRKSRNWQDTLQATQNLNALGFASATDWRLPNIKELASILELNCLTTSANLAINLDIFPSANSKLWSSTPHRGTVPSGDGSTDINLAWIVLFRSDTNIGARPEEITQLNFARLIRGESKLGGD